MKSNFLTATLIAATLLVSNLAFAQKPQTATAPRTTAAAPTTGGATLPEIKFTEYKLKNGLRVILHEDRSTPIVGVNLWYHVGSKNEVQGRTGFAHLFEHMMFQGSKNYDDDFFKPIQEAGGTLNGSTNPDRTNYWEVVPSNFLERALFMEADRMGNLLDVLNEAKLSNQRDVVKNEKRQNYDNRPYGLVGARINEILYPESHPYRWLTIGSLDDLTNASLDDVKGFFRRYYTPNNASLCIAGDFNPQQARQWVEKYFGSIASGPEIPKVNPPQPRLNGERREAMQDRVTLPRLYMVWHTMPQYTPDEPAADTLATILGGGKSSRLYKALVYDRQIAQDVSAFNGSQEIAGTFRIIATPKPGKTLAELEAAINEEIERIKKESPTAGELARAYNVREAAFVYSLQTVGGFGGRNDQLNQYATFVGQPGYFQQDLARYSRVTAEDVKRIANQYLTNNRLIVTVTPRAQGARQGRAAATTGDPAPASPAQAATPAAQQTAPAAPGAAATATQPPRIAQQPTGDRPAGAQTVTRTEAGATTPAGAAPPQSAAPGGNTPQGKRDTKARETSSANLPKPEGDPRFTLPRIQRRTLSNGLEVLFVEQHETPVVNMNLVIKSGAASNTAETAGLASLTSDLIDEGTKTRGALEISNALADIGARLSTSAALDSSGVELLTLTRHLDRALDIYSDVILNAALPETDFKRLRDSRLTFLRQQRDNADAIANNVYASILYGRNHPYGNPQLGDETTLRRFTREDVSRFYETYYRPNNATLIVTGDVSPDALMPKLESAFGKWQRGRVPQTSISDPAPRQQTAIYLVDRPGAAQSVIQIGQVGVARSTSDYFPLVVLNTMLGGQFVSRVNLNLREEKGYTYGARTAFSYRRAAGPFTASAGVQTAVTKESVQEFLKELRGIRGDIPVTPQELDYAKQAIIRGFPRGFETSGQLAGRLEDIVLYGLPDDYFNNYIARVQAVTIDDIKRVANRYLDPSKMVILVVGDRNVIEPGLRSLEGLGATITVLDAEGRPAQSGADAGATRSGGTQQR